MDPYVAFGLAMCVLVGLSLGGTAWLAAHFNRRAKADLAERLAPLAAVLDGETDLEEATVKGRYRGQLAFGRVAAAQGGFGRLFHVEVVDAAGGAGWEWSSLPEKGAPAPKRAFEGDPAIERRLGADLDFAALAAAAVPDDLRQRFGFLYDPAAGMVRLSREMHGRLDIPDAETFRRQLDALVHLGEANRRAQGAPAPGAAAAPPDPSPEAAAPDSPPRPPAAG